MLRALLLLLVLAPLAAAEVRVFAAASLTDALTEIAGQYGKRTGERIVFNFAGSSTLERQIELGAPADLFASADADKMDRLARLGRIDASTRVSLLSNQLVVVVPRGETTVVRSARDLAKLRRLALAEPSSVPAGIYARKWLERTGVWASVAPKVVPVENVRAALAAVEAGNADAAVVYRTDAAISKRVRVAYAVPAADGPAIDYPFAVTSDAANAAAAKRFLGFLRSDAARAVFRRYGFICR
jgi:molybdate transport system substrate-binding protein